jgi:hypothetical protein
VEANRSHDGYRSSGFIALSSSGCLGDTPRVDAASMADTAVRTHRPGRDHRIERASRLIPEKRLAFADLHTHSHLSDGEGDAGLAFERMRAAGLDVAALTDHVRLGADLAFEPADAGDEPAWRSTVGLQRPGWQLLGFLSEMATEDGDFVAFRGFEWTSPSLGHLNVLGSAQMIDPLGTGGIAASDLDAAWYAEGLGRVSPEAADALRAITAALPARADLTGFYVWLSRAAGAATDHAPVASFNHPGRDGTDFDGFAVVPSARERMASFEIFNRDQDQLFEGIDRGDPSPLIACLANGWRPGLSGVSDDHSDGWGARPGMGMTGLWVRELSRAGVIEALLARRFYATRVPGLRLEVVVDGRAMGGLVGADPDRAHVELSLDAPSLLGRPLVLQVLTPDAPLPRIHASHPIAGDGRPTSFELTPPPTDGWIVMRITDPGRPADPRAPYAWRAAGAAVAYTGPFFLSR